MEPAPGTATRIVVRPVAALLPLGFLALDLAPTTVFAALQLGLVPPEQGRIAALTALLATVPLQLIASAVGFAARDRWRPRAWASSQGRGRRWGSPR